MFNSWIFWLIVTFIALAIGVFLSWLEKKSSKKIFLGQPSKYPSELVDALKEYFKTQDKIKSAYLTQIFNGLKNEPPHPIIGIEVSDDFHRIQKECGNIVNKIINKAEFVDFIPLGKDEVSEYMKKQTEPFYKK